MNKLKKLAGFIAFLIFMSGSMTAIFTWIGLSSERAFLSIWLPTWIRAIFLMIPVGFSILYILSLLFDKFLPDLSFIKTSILQAIIMAIVMDGLMTGLAAYETYNFSVAAVGPWMDALIAGLPVGFAISLLMTFFIKPRLERFMNA